jgi:hypothetical protein
MGFGYGCKNCRKAVNSSSRCEHCSSSNVDRIWKCGRCSAIGIGCPPGNTCKKCGSTDVRPGEIQEQIIEKTKEM